MAPAWRGIQNPPSPVSLNGIKIQIFRSEVVHLCSSSKLKIIFQQEKNPSCKTTIWTKPHVFHFGSVTPPPRSTPGGPDVTHARMRSEAVYFVLLQVTCLWVRETFSQRHITAHQFYCAAFKKAGNRHGVNTQVRALSIQVGNG